LRIFLDTSFLVSLYSFDANSAEAARTLQSVPSSALLILTDLVALEVVNALELRQFRKQDSAERILLSLDAFDDDVRTGQLQLHAMPGSAFGRARELSVRTTPRLGTRTSDLLHVAVALEMSADCFYSFDKQQKRLAEEMDLKVNL
jgi:predicted nucleic acid-binding protein